MNQFDPRPKAGIYRWVDPNGIDYIGKAHDLSRRVNQYYNTDYKNCINNSWHSCPNTLPVNRFLAQAFRYYGKNNMKCYIICSDLPGKFGEKLEEVLVYNEDEQILSKNSIFPFGYNLRYNTKEVSKYNPRSKYYINFLHFLESLSLSDYDIFLLFFTNIGRSFRHQFCYIFDTHFKHKSDYQNVTMEVLINWKNYKHINKL